MENYRELQREFGRIARKYDHGKASRDTREFVNWIHPRATDCALDVCCGTGALARRLSKAARAVTGVDISPAMLCLAQRHRGAVRFALGDARHLPFRSGAFDLAVCSYSLANFARPRFILRELARVVRSSGHIAILDVLAPEDPAERRRLNRLEAKRSHLYTRIRSHSELLRSIAGAKLIVEREQLHRRRQHWKDWQRLSSAASRMRPEEVIPGKWPSSGKGCFRRTGGHRVICYVTGWFLLRPA